MPSKSEVTREKIIAAAENLFFEKGLFSTSQQEIADRAGVNRGLIHHYFGTKEAIALLIFEQLDQSFYHLIWDLFFRDEPDTVYISIAQGRLVINYLLANANVKRFYMDLIWHNICTDYIEQAISRDFQEECRYLALPYSPEEMKLYSMLLASVECKLLSTQIDASYPIPVEKIISIKNRIHLNILRLPSEQAEAKIDRAVRFARTIRYKLADSFHVKRENIIILK